MNVWSDFILDKIILKGNILMELVNHVQALIKDILEVQIIDGKVLVLEIITVIFGV